MFRGTQLLNAHLSISARTLSCGQYKHLLKAHVLYKPTTVNE